MDKELLSKRKYFYILTRDDERLHIQKVPIIYINKHYVYFRLNGSDILSYVEFGDVRDDISEIDLADLDRYSRRYLWGVPDDLHEKNREYILRAKEKKLQDALAIAQKDFEKAARNLEIAEKKYKGLQEAASAMQTKFDYDAIDGWPSYIV